MYRLNPLDRDVLITSDEVIKKASIQQQADVRLLQNSIEVAEERFIVPVLGNALYENFIAVKNKIVDSSNIATYTTAVNVGNTGPAIVLAEGMRINAIEFVTQLHYINLWNRFLWKITAECVHYVYAPMNWLRSTAQGEQMNNPKSITNEGSGAASGDLKDIKFKMDKLLMDHIDPMIERMKVWLYDNREDFNLYVPEKVDGTSIKRKTPWVHGIYDTPRRDCSNYVPTYTGLPMILEDDNDLNIISE